ncbi:elongator complex protein 5 [Aristolochia californica]|uniref:elongator complex protein 5 n=1 Tax=Aristolochia californica TaxID=171875 RepID=UPI0035E2F248
MTETICRTLRDGAFGGEHAPALTIKDTLQVPLGFKAFDHFLCSLVHNISLEKSQACGLVLVVLERSPVFYFDMLKSRGFDAASLNKWLRILDLYSDPLGWKDRLPNLQISEIVLNAFKDVGDMEKLFTTIVDVGKGMVGQSKVRFSLAIDSISAVLRHASVPSMSGLLSNLRSHDQVSSTFWLIHSDLHEARATLALEYISSMIASLDPMTPLGDRQLSPAGSMSNLGEISQSGKCNVRLKRRNGRVKVLVEEFHIEQSGIKFGPIVDENVMINQNLLPKVQFNLVLTEKERVDRARVVLPFEHQGNGKTIQIYDGRRSLPEGQTDPHLVRQIEDTSKLTRETNSGKGEIHYLRDSEDEQPDSDEDPDDDLDI